jgi:hypothetical protein
LQNSKLGVVHSSGCNSTKHQRAPTVVVGSDLWGIGDGLMLYLVAPLELV